MKFPLVSNRFPAFALATCLGILLPWVSGATGPAWSMDQVTIERNGVRMELEGEIVVKAQDGGLMFRGVDGHIWLIQPQEIRSQSSDNRPFQGIDAKRLAQQISQKLPASAGTFRTLQSRDLVILYNTSPLYANWVKSLYLRLTVAFRNYWENQGRELDSPDVPLAVIIFQSKAEFDAYARATLGSAQGNALAYYNIQSNQVVMYDLTGVSQFGGQRISSAGQLNRILQQPAAESMVATIVHEAVHQLAYNSGLQNRFGPYPFWLNEGLAMFFEVPDLKSRRGWHGIGKINPVRLNQLKLMVRSGRTDFFNEVLRDDQRFRDPDETLNAYAEAWALNYYLLQREPKKYLAYLEEMNQMVPLTELSPEERIALFEKHFGDLQSLQTECLNFILR